MDFTLSLPQDLQHKIQKVVESAPQSQPVFYELWKYLTELDDGDRKKRKIAGGSGNNSANGNGAVDGGGGGGRDAAVDLDKCSVLTNISVSTPERRRFNVIFCHQSRTISIAKELSPLKIDYSFKIDDMTACLCLWVPDKAKPQYSLLLFSNESSEPQLQITLLEDKAENSLRQPCPDIQYREYTCKDFATQLIKNWGVTVETCNDEAYFAKAYRGNKEGCLYMLDSYVFFGFKKPVLLIPHTLIETVSYSNITRTTFNMTIKLSQPLSGNPALEYEFSMMDQEDYDDVNEYMTSKQFGNASMDESRRAKPTSNEYSNELTKAVHENGEHGDTNKKSDGTATGIAALTAEDEDEEEDEDYKAGSEEEDDGSASGSESEDDDDEDEEDDDEDDGGEDNGGE